MRVKSGPLLPRSAAMWAALVFGALTAAGAEALTRAKVIHDPTPTMPANHYGLLFTHAALAFGATLAVAQLVRLSSWDRGLSSDEWLDETDPDARDEDPWWLARFRDALGQIRGRHDRDSVAKNLSITRDALRAHLNAQLAPAILVAFLVPVVGFLIRWYNLASVEKALPSSDYARTLFQGSLEMVPVVLLVLVACLYGRILFTKWEAMAASQLRQRTPSTAGIDETEDAGTVILENARLSRPRPTSNPEPILAPGKSDRPSNVTSSRTIVEDAPPRESPRPVQEDPWAKPISTSKPARTPSQPPRPEPAVQDPPTYPRGMTLEDL